MVTINKIFEGIQGCSGLLKKGRLLVIARQSPHEKQPPPLFRNSINVGGDKNQSVRLARLEFSGAGFLKGSRIRSEITPVQVGFCKGDSLTG